MIYTIGHTESYLEYFVAAENGRRSFPIKKGRTKDYCGGSVWRSYKEAERHIGKTHSVFGVLADWEMDTEPSENGDWHDLLINARLVQIETI